MGSGRELFGLRKDGSEFPIEIGLRPIQVGGGLYVLSAIVNLTQRRLAEARFRAAVESAPAAMVMTDRGGLIVLVNGEAEKVFGYGRRELIGASIETLVPGRFRPEHPELRSGFGEGPEARRMGAGRDLFAVRKDGSEFPVEIGLNPVETEEGLLVLSAIVDITERKRSARQLETALAEKTVLLHEIHHRVKNNLQIISGLLQLQAGQAEVAGLRELLEQSQNRVQSMALIHELLYESGDFSRIRLDQYLQRLGALLWGGYLGTGEEVRFEAEVEEVNLDLSRAIGCGLLVNELLTNSLKHARAKTVRLTMRREEEAGRIAMGVSDDGRGLPEGVKLATARSLGLMLAVQLAEQIGAELRVESGDTGVSFRWEIPMRAEETA